MKLVNKVSNRFVSSRVLGTIIKHAIKLQHLNKFSLVWMNLKNISCVH